MMTLFGGYSVLKNDHRQNKVEVEIAKLSLRLRPLRTTTTTLKACYFFQRGNC